MIVATNLLCFIKGERQKKNEMAAINRFKKNVL